MRTLKEIEEVFRKLGLLDEKERERILSQGKVSKETITEVKYCVTSDDVTPSQGGQEKKDA